MSDKFLLGLQTDIEGKLESESFFDTVNVVSLRKAVASSEANEESVFMTAKGGLYGAGVVVGMPFIDVQSAGGPGPEMDVTLPIRVYEFPEENMKPGVGTQMSAEEIALEVLELLHRWSMNDKCTMWPDKMTPNTDLAGVVAYDLTFKGRRATSRQPRVELPAISENSHVVTLTNVTSGATIYYTLDVSFPGKGNAAAYIYIAPFAVLAGQTVRWAGYKTAMDGSDAGAALIT